MLDCDLLVFGMAFPMNWCGLEVTEREGFLSAFLIKSDEGQAHLTLVTSMPFDNAALHTAEPVSRRGLGHCARRNKEWACAPMNPLPPTTRIFFTTVFMPFGCASEDASVECESWRESAKRATRAVDDVERACRLPNRKFPSSLELSVCAGIH